MIKKLVIVFIFLHQVSCKEIIKEAIQSTNSSVENLSADNYKEITVDELYKLSVPKYMKEMNNLNEEASLQYANIYKEAYTIVIHENKQDFIDSFKEYDEYKEELSVIENYSQAQTNFFKESANIKEIEPYGLTEINGLDARQTKMKGNVEGQDITYIIGYVEGEDNLYMIMSWTLLDRLARFENTFEAINSSFKLIKN